jgi:hypothetical protein
MTGTPQNLIVMRCKLEELWENVTNQLAQSDWQRVR